MVQTAQPQVQQVEQVIDEGSVNASPARMVWIMPAPLYQAIQVGVLAIDENVLSRPARITMAVILPVCQGAWMTK